MADDKQDLDTNAGKTDTTSFAVRFQLVADIVQRANNRFVQVTADPGPIADPAVQAALQSILTQTAALTAKVTALVATTGTPGTTP